MKRIETEEELEREKTWSPSRPKGEESAATTKRTLDIDESGQMKPAKPDRGESDDDLLPPPRGSHRE